jgi:hypothetical protein
MRMGGSENNARRTKSHTDIRFHAFYPPQRFEQEHSTSYCVLIAELMRLKCPRIQQVDQSYSGAGRDIGRWTRETESELTQSGTFWTHNSAHGAFTALLVSVYISLSISAKTVLATGSIFYGNQDRYILTLCLCQSPSSASRGLGRQSPDCWTWRVSDRQGQRCDFSRAYGHAQIFCVW